MAFVTLGFLGAGRVLGLDAYIEDMDLGADRTLKYVLG
jgi:thiosulfate dehydrogenase [quinone] large subunit